MLRVKHGMSQAGAAWVLVVTGLLLVAGCAGSPTQDRFVHIKGLAFVSTNLSPPSSWELNGDALRVKRQLPSAVDTSSFVVGVEKEDYFHRDTYQAVWIVGSADGGSLIATRAYVEGKLIHRAEPGRRLLGPEPALESVRIPLSGDEVTKVERQLLRLSPEKCTDTVIFFPEQQPVYHVHLGLHGKDHSFSVFAPALSRLAREADRSIHHLAQYDRLSRREADVVAVILDFADKRLMYHLKVGSRSESGAEGPTSDGFSRPQ
jgi:hypothetical protein